MPGFYVGAGAELSSHVCTASTNNREISPVAVYQCKTALI